MSISIFSCGRNAATLLPVDIEVRLEQTGEVMKVIEVIKPVGVAYIDYVTHVTPVIERIVTGAIDSFIGVS